MDQSSMKTPSENTDSSSRHSNHQTSTSTGKGTVESSSIREVNAGLPCVVCDQTVLINQETWTDLRYPPALCLKCLAAVPSGLIQQIYVLRAQVRSLNDELKELRSVCESLKEDLDELSNTQN